MIRALRKSRGFTAWIIVAALFAMQVAVAAYACPYMAGSTAHAQMSPDCASGASVSGQPKLCMAHNDAQSQLTGDQLIKLPVAPLAVIASFHTPSIAPSAQAVRVASYVSSRLVSDNAPPLFIRYQVLRR